jgi:hypothetical protein
MNGTAEEEPKQFWMAARAHTQEVIKLSEEEFSRGADGVTIPFANNNIYLVRPPRGGWIHNPVCSSVRTNAEGHRTHPTE